jgi:hypothetical protein
MEKKLKHLKTRVREHLNETIWRIPWVTEQKHQHSSSSVFIFYMNCMPVSALSGLTKVNLRPVINWNGFCGIRWNTFLNTGLNKKWLIETSRLEDRKNFGFSWGIVGFWECETWCLTSNSFLCKWLAEDVKGCVLSFQRSLGSNPFATQRISNIGVFHENFRCGFSSFH